MKSILLIGLGRFGKHIAMELHSLGHQVMAVDHNEERVNEVLSFVTSAQIGDSTSEDFLSSLGVRNFDVCIVAIGNNFQSSLETTSLLKELGARLVVSRAARDVHAKFLLRNGADEVVYPEKQLAKWTAIRCSSDHIRDFVDLDGDHDLFEVDLPDQWAGMSVAQIDIRKQYGINIIGVRHNGKIEYSVTPPTLPRYIRMIRMIREAVPRPGVMPKLSPTVPTAEAVSNRQAIMGSCSRRLMRSAPVRQRLRYIIRMAAASATVSWAIRRRKSSGFSFR